VLMLLGLALVPTIVGHTVLNRSMMVLPAQTVSLINILQFVFAGVTAYLIFGEIPQASFYIATFLVLGGAVTVILSQRRKSGEKNSANAR
jgi:drug/metabolite transporter (DMT)-like permease